MPRTSDQAEQSQGLSKTRKHQKQKGGSEKAREKLKAKDRWIFILNDGAMQGVKAENEHQLCVCKLRHPRIKTGILFLVNTGTQNILQLSCFQEKFRSWFLGDTVHSDGNVYLTTPVDPLFLVLPYLINAGEGKRFMTLDQIMCDEEFPDCTTLQACCDQGQLNLVADCKDIDDDVQVFRFSKDKTLAWLKEKTQAVADILEKKQISVSTQGSHSAIFVRSKSAEIPKEAYLEYAHGIVSDYLSPDLEEDFRNFLGLPEKNSNTPAVENASENEPPSKKTKMSADEGPTEDYSKGVDLKRSNSKTGKLSTAQKQLSKVDKSGMKSISSFFKAKS